MPAKRRGRKPPVNNEQNKRIAQYARQSEIARHFPLMADDDIALATSLDDATYKRFLAGSLSNRREIIGAQRRKQQRRQRMQRARRTRPRTTAARRPTTPRKRPSTKRRPASKKGKPAARRKSPRAKRGTTARRR
jgi:hypothetical protein